MQKAQMQRLITQGAALIAQELQTFQYMTVVSLLTGINGQVVKL